MATVITMLDSAVDEGDGMNHLPGANTHQTLCGWCDAGNWTAEFEGEVTCDNCKTAARAVFASCKKSEVR